jgi:hypothetical protein
MLPGLQPVRRLGELPLDSNEYGFLHARLLRERNRIADALDRAAEHIEILLADLR